MEKTKKLTFFRNGKEPDEYAFTFPICEAELTPSVVDELNMHHALKRFANELLAQRDDNTIGVEIHSVGVTFMLKRDKA